MATVTIQEARATLPELIHRLAVGDEVVIIENDQPVARLTLTTVMPTNQPRKLGTLEGSVLYMAPDFDAPLEEFAEYME